MELNVDCMRDILIYLSQNLTGERDRNYVTFNQIDLLKISNDMSDKYDAVTIWYSTKMLDECNYIVCDTRTVTHGQLAYFYVTGMTYQGHKFLESILPQPIWEKTKSIISKVGSHSLSFVEDTAQKVAIESAKQIITVVMTQK
jgi:hypothetical protein